MRDGSPSWRTLAAAPRWARLPVAGIVVYVVVAQVALGWGVPQSMAARAGVGLGIAASLLLLASGAAALADDGPLPRRIALALLRAGSALILLGLPASILWRTTEILEIGEGQVVPAGALPGLPGLDFGEVTLAPRGEGMLLSKTVSMAARTEDGRRADIGLWPPALLGGWRVTVLRFGYAPEIEWRGADGEPFVDGYAMVGTFPKTEADARLVTWTPPPNVMMGVGFYPPDLEDLLTPPRSRHHLFLRLEEATLAGTRRNLRDPEAHRWLADGRPGSPIWFVQVFEGRKQLYEGRLPAGSAAHFAGGSIRVGTDLVLWTEIQAVRDPWAWVALAGAIMAALGTMLGAVGALARRLRAAPPV